MRSLITSVLNKSNIINKFIRSSGFATSGTDELYPYKCRRYKDLTEEFISQRVCDNNELKIDSFKQLITDKESEEAIKEVVEYYNVMKTRTRFFPKELTVEDMRYLLTKTTNFFRRKRHIDFFFVREFDIWRHNKCTVISKAIKKAEKDSFEENFGQIGCFDSNNELQYGFWKNTLFSRYFDKALRHYSFNRLRTASLFGQKIILDCSFDTEMEEYETTSAGKQLIRIYKANRYESRDPFDIHLCGFKTTSRVYKHFSNSFPDQNFDQHFFNIHTKTYSELFPNQKLIYLTPDARAILNQFDPNAVYILGALVGKTCRLPLTAFKARREGIEHFRLPIHHYVELAPGVKKVLSFQGVFKILLEVREHGNWKLAIERGIQDHKLRYENDFMTSDEEIDDNHKDNQIQNTNILISNQ